MLFRVRGGIESSFTPKPGRTPPVNNKYNYAIGIELGITTADSNIIQATPGDPGPAIFVSIAVASALIQNNSLRGPLSQVYGSSWYGYDHSVPPATFINNAYAPNWSAPFPPAHLHPAVVSNPTSNSLTLSWETSDDASGLHAGCFDRLQFRQLCGPLSDFGSGDRHLGRRVGTFSSNTTYYLRLRAYNAQGISDTSGVSQGVTSAGASSPIVTITSPACSNAEPGGRGADCYVHSCSIGFTESAINLFVELW